MSHITGGVRLIEHPAPRSGSLPGGDRPSGIAGADPAGAQGPVSLRSTRDAPRPAVRAPVSGWALSQHHHGVSVGQRVPLLVAAFQLAVVPSMAVWLARPDLQRAAALLAGLPLAIGSLLGLLFARSFARRLRAIARVAERAAAGELHQKLPCDRGGDEVASLSRSLGALLGEIERLTGEARGQAALQQARLSALVEERTAELTERNDALRWVLDNVDQGFCTIDAEGRISGEPSATVVRWLGPVPASRRLWDYIAAVAPGMGANLEVCWAQVVVGALPLEITLDQMPRRFNVGGRHFSLELKPILAADGAIARAIVVLSDITHDVERERAEAEQGEALRLFSRLNADRAGVIEFFADVRPLVRQITRETPADVMITKRLLHTLKGNAAVMGIQRLSGLCHSIETAMEETNANISPADRLRLLDCWTSISDQVIALMGDGGPNALSIAMDDYQDALGALVARRPAADIYGLLESWKLESTEVRLRRAARQATSLAQQLGKVPVDVCVESNKLRLDPELWNGVWAQLPHLIRNAIDHGLEAASGSAASLEPTQLFLRTIMDASTFVIEVEDRGRGVDWDKVRQLASARGMPTNTHADLERALFADGLSTKEHVEETSGRGLGMAAVASAVKARGGQIHVRSSAGKGTLVRLSWPAAVAQARSAHLPRKITRSAFLV